MHRPELFLISKELMSACLVSEVYATYDDMAELGIAHLPYSELDIDMRGSVFSCIGKDSIFITSSDVEDANTTFLYETEIKFRFRNEKCYQVLVKPDCPACRDSGRKHTNHGWLDLNDHRRIEDVMEYYDEAEKYKKMLIVLLASRGVVKTRTKDKLAALGIGKKDNYRPIYTTTLSLPLALHSGEDKAGSGATLRPHLRRGHIRRQRHGPRLEFTKKIWIQPCFINADENYISQRSAYNTSMKNMQGAPE